MIKYCIYIVNSLLVIISVTCWSYFCVAESEHERLDILENLVRYSDFIGIIRINDGSSPYSRIPKKIWQTVNGETIDSLLDKELIGKTILISNRQILSNNKRKAFPVFLRNGTFLAFLKKTDNNIYSPLNSSSLMRIMDDRVLPVWENVAPNQKILPPETDKVLEDVYKMIRYVNSNK